MAEQIGMIAVAFPVAEPQRALLRRLITHPLPSLYRTGAEERPCASCGMTLNVGPRILAQVVSGGVKVYCPICMMAMRQGVPNDAVDVMNLGNPESGWET